MIVSHAYIGECREGILNSRHSAPAYLFFSNTLFDDEAQLSVAINVAREDYIYSWRVLQSLPKDKEGNVLIDKMTPEQDFVYLMETEGVETAVAAAEEQVEYDMSQVKDIEANDKMSPRDKRGKTRKFTDDIAG